ncbi:hypothetical protein PsorP6_018164 [Peronosclerospora sorghi]|uniref:Uncharacterized protein n=1 Tax=Peronosclerospora sorghi TaxID=230839 RepID=A0ACC0WDX5_9STRA|nr:hypothetical protein PsorP6_018164 [Peronosclerospora sorghi]
MEAKQDALVDVIRAIIGPRDMSREHILAILKQAGDDPNKAVDLFFFTEAANGIAPKINDVEGSDEEEDIKDISCVETPALRQVVNIDDGASKCSAKGTPQAEEISGILGEEVKRDIILTLFRRSRNNLQ